MTSAHQEKWNKCLDIIRDNISPKSFDTWFKPIVPLKLDNQTLIIQVPSTFVYEYLEEHYIDLLRKTLRKVIGEQARLEYSVVMSNAGDSPYTVNYPTENNTQFQNQPKTGDAERTFKNPFANQNVKKPQIDPQLKSSYNFDNYIIGDCNSLAHAAGIAAAKNPGRTTFNPLLIHGKSGLGKTHLAHAIGIETLSNHPEKRVLYVTANLFMNQYTEASRNGQINDFMHFYQSIDVLILDDVQELAGKTGTQRTFFHIFNHLHQSGKQLILTSDTPPAELDGMEERLLSRFRWGLSAKLEIPNFETRMQILKLKAKRDGVEFSEEIFEHIASHVTGNIRELEGTLVSLLAYTINKNEITIDLANNVINSLVKSTKVELSVNHIAKVVCESLNIQLEDMISKTRKREIVQARQLTMYFSKEMTNQSLSAIGAQVGKKDHATVMHACKTIKNLLDTDKNFLTIFKQIERKLKL
ncbi:MAG: chromosomal replication initiator protein DnaA [Mangrovibacterium sp.]